MNANGFERQWWRIGGALGIAFTVVFLINIFISGEPPSRDDSIEEIRQYFTDDGDLYLITDYIGGLAFFVFFLPYLVTLRWVLGPSEGSPPIWSWLTVIGGVLMVAFGGAATVFWGALANGVAEHPEIDDSSIRLLMELDLYAFTLWGYTMALFTGAASIVILRYGGLWRWLGIVGLIAAVLNLISVAWPIDGDDEGAIAIFGFIGAPLTLLFVLGSSINMLMMKEEPGPSEGASAPA
jgi:hypothetical protein